MKIGDKIPPKTKKFEIDKRLLDLAEKAESGCSLAFGEINRNARINGEKVLNAFVNNRFSSSCLNGTTGYGYDDLGRDTIEKIFAEVFGAEDALVRHTLVSGTHALTVALFGLLKTGDKLVSLTGKPYDTLEEVIGIRGNASGSLRDFGIEYSQVDLLPDGTPDLAEIFRKGRDAKVAYIQRSRGYSHRPALTISMISEIVSAAKNANPDVIVLVDNCYGEFVETTEPCDAGADVAVGSLIKNPGGGIAETGGYITGKKNFIKMIENRLTSPGTGREVGCSLGQNKLIAQGLFLAPEIVAGALRTASFVQEIMTLLGFNVLPKPNTKRGDIVTAIEMPDADSLIHFCKGIQKGSPVDSFVSCEPWDMPGYDAKVIMAAGAFNMGASIELSCDAPIREPYTAYIQGGLTYATGRMGVLVALQEMLNNHCLKTWAL
ncbi:MAG: methionine gamma-lyase family protein [Ruminococcus sp.]|jgi:cystathionine beta-lyase family protein involved in aluminum resistance|nr:methionine gamma-lyase family protein [Ruminococcus sp.]